MNEVQVKVLQETFEHFGDELAGLLSDGWQVMYQQVIYINREENDYISEPQMLAVLQNVGLETLRDKIWQRSAIEALQVQVAQLKANLQAINHALDVNLEGTVRDLVERIDLMMDGVDDDTAEAIPVNFIDLRSIQIRNPVIDARSERERLIDAEIAADLAAGVG